MAAQSLKLSQQQSLDSAHQRAAFTGKIRIGLFLECSLEEIAAADADAKGDDTFVSFSRCILEDSVTAVQTTSLKEHAAQ